MIFLIDVLQPPAHNRGLDKQREGIDYDRADRSVNQLWPGLVADEWHNNHHLFPKSARSGFKAYQLDIAWIYIRLLHRVGVVSHYRDDKQNIVAKYLK